MASISHFGEIGDKYALHSFSLLMPYISFTNFFFNHVLRWVIDIMGGDELEQHISSFQSHVGVCHWLHGASKLKQCTGQEHWEIEKIIIIAGAGAVDCDVPDVLPALCAIVDFIFQAQGVLLFEEHLHSIHEALKKFHDLKNTIVMAGGCRGKTA